MATLYAAIMVSTSSYFVCSCLYIDTICDHFEILIHSIENDVEESLKENKPPLSRKIGQRVKNIVIEAINIHVKALE